LNKSHDHYLKKKNLKKRGGETKKRGDRDRVVVGERKAAKPSKNLAGNKGKKDRTCKRKGGKVGNQSVEPIEGNKTRVKANNEQGIKSGRHNGMVTVDSAVGCA